MKEILQNLAKALILVVIGFALAKFFFSNGDTTISSQPTVVRDSGLSVAERKQYKKQLAEKQSIIDKFTGQDRPGTPTQIVTGPVTMNPLQPEKLPPETVKVKGECPQQEAYPYDLIYMGEITRHSLSLSTFNPYLEQAKKDPLKRYTFKREGMNFRVAVERNTGDNIDGLKVVWDDPLLYIDGIYLGAAAGFPFRWYASVDARIVLFKDIELRPEVRTDPTPLWLSARYRIR